MSFDFSTPRNFGAPKKANKVAIVGSSGISLGKVPWNDHQFEIWGLAWRQDLARKDRLFDVHRINHTRSSVPHDYEKHLAAAGCPVFLQRAHSDIPNSLPIPLDLLLDAFGDYNASSVSYMIGVAILERYEEIQLHGIDLLDSSEYSYQRPNAEYMLGFARGLDIKVTVPPTSAMLKFTHRYGYDLPPDNGSLSVDVIDERIKTYTGELEQAAAQVHGIEGALSELNQQRTALFQAKKGRVTDV